MKTCALLMAIVLHAAAGEPDFVRAENLFLLDRPAIPDLFKEQQMHVDVEATGKSFEVVCTIGSSGYLQNCIAFDGGYPDKAFLRNVREYMQTWHYDTRSKTGESVVGKKSDSVGSIRCNKKCPAGEGGARGGFTRYAY